MICKNLTVNEFKMEGNMAERVYTRAVILRLLHNLKFNKNFKSVYCLGIPALQQHSVFTLSSGYRFIGLFLRTKSISLFIFINILFWAVISPLLLPMQ